MEEYKNWAIERLSIKFSNNLNIIDLGEGERGVYSNENIEINTILLTIPFNSLLTINSVINTPLENIKLLWREDDILAILLLYEKYIQKENSKWYLHIKYLPEVYHNTINFNNEELKLIEGSNLYITTINWKNQIQSDYNLILNKCQKLFESIDECLWLTFDNYLWALCTIWSRFVTINKNNTLYRSMVPFFDMLNHSPLSSVGHRYQADIDSLTLLTTQSLPKSNEITLNYGKLSNTKLMMLYGFSLIDNPFNSIELFTTMSPEAIEYEFKNELLELWGINHQRPFTIELSKENKCGIPKELIYCLRVQYGDWGMDEDDEEDYEDDSDNDDNDNDWSENEKELLSKYLNLTQSSSSSSLPSSQLSSSNQTTRELKRKEVRYKTLLKGRKGPITLGNEMIISQILLQSLSNMLNSYSTTLQEDEIILNELKNTIRNESIILQDSTTNTIVNSINMIYPSERVKNSIIMRYSEKVVLQSTINWISCHMTDLLPDS